MRKNVFIKGILILFCFCLLFAMQAPGSMRAGKTKSFSATVKVGKKGAKEKNFSVVDDVAHNGKKFIYMPKIQEGYKIVNVSTRPFFKVNHTEGGEYEFSVMPEDITIYFEIEPIRYRIAFDGDKTPLNYVDGDMDPLEVNYDEEVQLPFCQFQSKQGWNFKGWYLRDNISYKDQSKVKNLSSTDGDTVTLKAIWENPSGFIYRSPNKMSTASIFSTGNIVIWVGAGVLVVAIVVLSIFFVKKKK